MKLNMHNGDLFKDAEKVGDWNRRYVQCISGDCACGAGIAVQFNEHFNVRERIPQPDSKLWYPIGTVIYTEPVFNLVTKLRYYEKPSEFSIRRALRTLRHNLLADPSIKTLIMPKLGCGLDRMSWKVVRAAIEDVLEDIDVDIHVYTRRGMSDEHN